MARKQTGRIFDVRRGDGHISTRQTKNGEIRYRARWREIEASGKQALKSKTFTDRESAEDHLRTIGREIRAGKYTPESRMTVGEAVEDYLRRGKGRWSTNTYASYRQVAKTRVIPHLGSIRLSELTTWQVQDWIDHLTACKYKPSSVRNSRIVLLGTCKDATRLGILKTNPVVGTQMPKRVKRPPTIWSSSDVAAIMEAVKDDPVMSGIYAVGLTTGMRPGEIRNLKWKHIDFSDRTILCEVSVTRDENFQQIEGSTTKTQRSRYIALTDAAAKALERVRKDQVERRLKAEKWEDRGLVFDRGDGRLLPNESLHWKHRLAIAAAGVPKIRMHDLRHSAATLMLKAGIPLEIVSHMLGHASQYITADIYGHIDVSMQRSAVDALGSVVSRKAK